MIIPTKIPDWATPTVLKEMHDKGQTLRQIAAIVGVSTTRVWQLIHKPTKQDVALDTHALEVALENRNTEDSLHK